MKKLLFILMILASGCAATAEDDDQTEVVINYLVRPANENCPPLPPLPPGATRFEERLNNAVVRELYAQCAESKR